MHKNKENVIRVKRSVYAVSVALASLVAANAAMAQEATPAAPAAATEVQQVLVIGARASQQSSIDRKKNAATAMDSIISEDVGSFPDRNVGEAISRIAGIAISRGDFGEGTSVSVRGNGADLTRVEMDGQAVQSGGGTDLLGGGDGRGVEFRELSSDLIKSVDVVKGSTADMVEGSLGGGIIIKTRNGLDFKKPFYSLRLGATQGMLNKKITPNLNLVLADKFLDNRLGVLVNLNQSKYSNESHSLANGGSNNQQGPMRSLDLDNSPEKTFTLNPAALSKTDPAVNTTLNAAALTGGGFFNAATPMELVTKAGAAATKADCYTAFPTLSTAQTNAISGSTARSGAITARANELTSCLNQWNDYSPSIIRSYVRSQEDTRVGGDIRLDFKVNNQLSVYGKLSRNKRSVDDVVGNLQFGNVSVNNGAVNSGSTGYIGTSISDNVTTNTRTAVPGSGYYTFPNTVSFRASGAMPINGATANIKPGYTVDDTHHLTSFTITDGGYSTDMIFSKVETTADYFQAGGIYKEGDLKIEFLAGDARSTSIRHDRRSAISYGYGEANFKLLPDGAWGFSLPAGSNANQLNYDAYARLLAPVASAAAPLTDFNTVAVPAYTAAQRAQYTPGMNMQVIRVRQSESEEMTAKADLTYNLRDRLPYFTTIKAGFNLRKTSSEFWSPLGSTTIKDPVGTFGAAGYEPGIYLPGFNSSSRVVGCENTPGSLAAGGQKCAYGYTPNPNPSSPYSGTTTLTQEQYKELVKQVLSVAPSGQFYGGAPNRSPELIDGWNQIDINKLYALTNTPVNLDCMVRCTATDGKVYDQPISRFNEKSYAGYFMADFDIDRLPFSKTPLPFGIELSGNIGARVVKTNVMGTGNMSFTTIKKTATYNPDDRDAIGGTTRTVFRKNTMIQDDSTDVLPIYNLALWPIPNKLVVRYNHAKTVARPGMSRLLPSTGCTYDERASDLPDESDGSDPDQNCGGVMGNPGIKPYTNTNKNLAVEWYVNKDTMFSMAAFRQIGIIGAPNKIVPRTGVKVFEGSDAVDPVTGTRLADLEFKFNQYDNLDPSVRRGVEFASKTAFTFLPSVLRYTGLDANYTRVRSDAAQPSVDLLTGDVLPPVGEPKYSYNASLWYDDGRFSARVALQVVAPRYQCFAPCTTSNIGVNNFPAEGATSIRAPYNPGLPLFSDATRFIDVKMAYKFKNNIEVFAEARNVTNQRTHNSTGGYEDYSGGVPFLYGDNFNGRRIMVGLNIRSAQ